MKTDTYTPTKIETWPVKEYEAAVKVWRETTARQCFGMMEGPFGARCALGVLGGGYAAIERFGFAAYGDWAECPSCGYALRKGLSFLTHWNDSHEFTFKEIADLAEAYPHLVFTS